MDESTNATLVALDQVCRGALNNYRDDPWRWPRESDLVVDLVTCLRTRVGSDARVDVSDDSIERGPYALTPGRRPRIPLVRTEVKVRPGKERVDIAILDKTHETAVHFQPFGVRDVTLSVEAKDVVALLEVKLCPHLYVKKSAESYESQWLDDLIKLDALAKTNEELLNVPRGLICIDTSLPLETIGIVYRKSEWVRRTVARLDAKESLDIARLWPLTDKKVLQIRKYGPKEKSIELTPCSSPIQPNMLHLWALAVQDPGAVQHVLPTQEDCGRSLAVDAVRARCWNVTIK